MRKGKSVLLIVCSFVLILAVSDGVGGLAGVMYNEPRIKPLIHGLGG
ncbi:hypothetical protein [Paenibacillus woosongensis]|nr:hypothetical protein [Paenibacillus woosongensis]